MANRFLSGTPQPAPFQNTQDAFTQFNQCRSNPIQFLQNRGINVPPEYQGNPELTARYLLNNLPPNVQQNKVFQVASMLRNLFGR